MTSGVGSAGAGSDGAAELKKWLTENPKVITAFAGVSGVGINAAPRALPAIRAAARRRRAAGARTAHHPRGNPAQNRQKKGHIRRPRALRIFSDTPGFSLIDLRRFDFFELSDLPTLPRFSPYLCECRYTDCRHLRDELCSPPSPKENQPLPGTRVTRRCTRSSNRRILTDRDITKIQNSANEKDARLFF